MKSVLFCETCFESSVSFKYFLCVKDLNMIIILVSLFKCVYNVLTRALVLKWACVLVSTVTILRANALWLAFPNYACVVAWDN